MKYLTRLSFFVFIVLLALPLTVNAQGSNPSIPNPPSEGEYVLDQLNWLTPVQEQDINAVVSELDTHGMAEIAVVTLDDCGEDKLKYRNDLFREWGIGHADDNDGLLILVCWYGGEKGKRSLEQETGYGMEGTIPDLMTSKVAKQYFVSAFQQNKPDNEVIASGEAGAALVAVVKAYDGIVRGDTPTELNESEVLPPWVFVLIIIVVIVITVLVLRLLLGFLGTGSGGGGAGPDIVAGGGGDSDSGSPFDGGDAGGGGSSTGF